MKMKANNHAAYVAPELEIVALAQEGVICYSFGDEGRPGSSLIDNNDEEGY